MDRENNMSRSKDYQRLLNSPQWAKVKAIVKARAGGLCERCKEEGFITPGVDCHHIRPVEQAKTVEGPDGMRARCYNPNNVMLLCVDCHIKTHREMRSHEGQIAKTLPKDEVKNDQLRQWIAKVSKAPIDENQFKTVKKGIRKTRYGWLTKEEYEKKRAEEHEAWIRRQGNGLNDTQTTASVDADAKD
jgi:5-methylcytosine-specific restriction endonuclease McrA